MFYLIESSLLKKNLAAITSRTPSGPATTKVVSLESNGSNKQAYM